MIYFIAGMTKLLDPDWNSGSALTDILRIREFSLPIFYNTHSNFFTEFATYFVIVYQVLFPFLVWLKKLKTVLISLGILQHLIIAFVVGLPSFGFIMIISYAIFYFPFFKTAGTKNS
jgi:hypothetical protein